MTLDPKLLVAARYTEGASKYDTLWSPIIYPMAVELFPALELGDESLVADIGCGSGMLAAEVRSVSPGARVVGADISEGMARVAFSNQRLLAAVADAGALPFASGSVDAAFSVFAFQHVPDPAAAISELARIVKPGCPAATVTWGQNKDSDAEKLFDDLLDEAGAAPYVAAIDSHPLLDSPEKIESLWVAAGLTVRRLWVSTPVHEWSTTSLMSTLTGYGSAKTRFDSLDALVQASIRERMAAQLALMNNEQLLWRPSVVFAIANS